MQHVEASEAGPPTHAWATAEEAAMDRPTGFQCAPAVATPTDPPGGAAPSPEATQRPPAAAQPSSPPPAAAPAPRPLAAPISHLLAGGELLAFDPPNGGPAAPAPLPAATLVLEFLFLRWNGWTRAHEVLVYRSWNDDGHLESLCLPTIAGSWLDVSDVMQSSLESGATRRVATGHLGPTGMPSQACAPPGLARTWLSPEAGLSFLTRATRAHPGAPAPVDPPQLATLQEPILSPTCWRYVECDGSTRTLPTTRWQPTT